LLNGALGHRSGHQAPHRVLLDNVPSISISNRRGVLFGFEAIVDQNCDDLAAEQKIRELRAAFRLSEASLMSLSYADLVGAHETDARV